MIGEERSPSKMAMTLWERRADYWNCTLDDDQE